MNLGLALNLNRVMRTGVGGLGGLGSDLRAQVISALFGAGEQGFLHDPKDISTLFTDDAKTSPVTSNGDVVGAVSDVSGNGLDWTQATEASKYTYHAASESVRHDGVDDYLTLSGIDLIPASGNKTWTFVYAYSQISVSDNLILLTQNGENDPWVLAAENGSSNTSIINAPSGVINRVRFDGVTETPSTRGDVYTLFQNSSFVLVEFTVTADVNTTWDALRIGKYFPSLFFTPSALDFCLLREGSLDVEQTDLVEDLARSRL